MQEIECWFVYKCLQGVNIVVTLDPFAKFASLLREIRRSYIGAVTRRNTAVAIRTGIHIC